MTRTYDAGTDDWRKLEALWEAAREYPPEQRDAFLASHAVTGPLRDELESLLARADSAEVFFDRLSAVVPRQGDAMLTDDHDPDADHAGAASEAPSRPDPLIGTRVGHYEIVARLGQGGMGIVYRATDLRLRRTVALKLLRAHASDDRRAKERLLVEARAAAALDHVNICTIYEVGETPEQSAFIAMGFYPGETLEQVLRRGPLPLATALDYATQIARGLGAAHERGIVHRDVKPANGIITSDGVVKLLDFGIARVPDVDVSRDGVTPGTIAYMSPEQVASRPLDQRTDLWSLGVVLYEMCTGERPFGGDSAGAVLYAILQHSPPPVSTVRHEPPAPIDAVIARLLAKVPEHRYRNAEQLIADLTPIADASPSARPESRSGAEPLASASQRDDGDTTATPQPPSARPRRRWMRRAAWLGAALLVAASWPMILEYVEGDEQPASPGPTTLPTNRTEMRLPSAGRMAAKDLHEQGINDVLFRTDSGRRKSRELFQRAVAADSTYAPAHAALALAGLMLGDNPSRFSIAEAEQHARTAIRLDSLVPDGHAALGRVLSFDYRFAEVEVHLKRAAELDPKTRFREFLIWTYMLMDRRADALKEAEEFERNLPGYPIAIAELAFAYALNGRCDEALARLATLQHMQPPPARVGGYAAQCHAVRGDWPQAIAAMRRVAETNDQALAFLGFMLARGGQMDSARAIRDTLLARRSQGKVSAWGLAVVHTGLGDLDRAFEWLDRSYEERSLRGQIMGPLFADLHRDPRFALVRRKLGIQQR